MNQTSSPLRVAVIGAGPAGFYTAEALLKGREDVSVDILDRLPTPFGLVRYGVAPDHGKMKSVTRMYDRTCRDPRVRFLGNVEYGRDLTREDLGRHYHAVVYAVGASADRALGIPGEDLPGSLSATQFVAWYNGHPDARHLAPDLDVERVAVIGMGNVAVDVTRILAKATDELHGTDIADHALAALADSRVREILMVGRRGPAQGKFTTKELRELGVLDNADIDVDPRELDRDAPGADAEGDAVTGRNLDVLRGFADTPPAGKPRRVGLRFRLSPVEIVGDGRVEGLRLERNRLDRREDGSVRAVPTGEFETWPVGMVVRSVGYRGRPLGDVPFDDRRGVIPNERGRVLDGPNGAPVPGEYVAGWIKRGPSGVIGTNKADAMETVRELLSDSLRPVAPERAAPDAVTDLLASRGVDVVDYERWCELDRIELAAGEAAGRPRVKLTRRSEMLRHAVPPTAETPG